MIQLSGIFSESLGGTCTIRGYAKYNEIVELSYPHPGYQRPAEDEHVAEISSFITSGSNSFSPEVAYITAAWLGGDSENAELAAQYCRTVYEAGFSPICPPLYLPLFLNDAVPEEHKSGIDMSRDLLRRSHVLVVCGHSMTESMKNDIAVAQRLGITATTLEGILTVKGQGRR